MKDLNWIKDLVRAEQQMEEVGIVDFSAGFDPQQVLHSETVSFQLRLKESFVEYASAFNQLRGVSLGGIKIYGVSQTEADFMLFRNGFKLIFSMKKPGIISIRFQHQGVQIVPGQAAHEKNTDSASNEDIIEARWGAFGEVIWAYDKYQVNYEYLVKYYLSRFIKESAK